mmetsp:Transcript_19341/g.53802  ORF Transcript_19341/g.53802 Transcript_19341/m.53802 type:complete len:264 (+) Transcript_19341:40-831(+)
MDYLLYTTLCLSLSPWSPEGAGHAEVVAPGLSLNKTNPLNYSTLDYTSCALLSPSLHVDIVAIVIAALLRALVGSRVIEDVGVTLVHDESIPIAAHHPDRTALLPLRVFIQRESLFVAVCLLRAVGRNAGHVARRRDAVRWPLASCGTRIIVQPRLPLWHLLLGEAASQDVDRRLIWQRAPPFLISWRNEDDEVQRSVQGQADGDQHEVYKDGWVAQVLLDAEHADEDLSEYIPKGRVRVDSAMVVTVVVAVIQCNVACGDDV